MPIVTSDIVRLEAKTDGSASHLSFCVSPISNSPVHMCRTHKGDRKKGWGMANNVRYANGHLRVKNRARLKAMGAGCGICKGRLGAIHYDEPSDHKHPLSFVVDEIIPVSKYYLGNYDTPRAAAEDFNNLQAAHYICNSMKSNKIDFVIDGRQGHKVNVSDGEW